MPKKRFGQIMIDLETLGTRADAVIMSIGAVKFDINSGEMDDAVFYASISIDSNHEAAPRHFSEDTINFWMKQSPEAKQVFGEDKTTLITALNDLADWIDHPDYEVWSNGADFDIPMLAHAYGTAGADVPWNFWNARCYRTFKNLPGMKKVPKVAPLIAHNALHDAIAQAKHLQAMFHALKEAA